MSRIGRMPIAIPAGVDVKINGSAVSVKGPKGQMQRVFSHLMTIKTEEGHIVIERNSDAPAERALHGTTRAVLNNMINGVHTGFQQILEVEGVGYRAEMDGATLVLHVGYSHPIRVEPPTGVSFEADAKTRQVKVIGFDKEQVGQVASDIRKVRPPEPYKGKGLRYSGEKVRRKAGKSGKGKK